MDRQESQGSDLEYLREDLIDIRTFVEELTGLHSRWRGTVILLEDQKIAPLRGRGALAEKRWNCDIWIDARLIPSPARWRTLIHEILHSVSVGLTEQDYVRFRGWEEGVVENLQRLLRPKILAGLGINIPDSLFADIERNWLYNDYIDALEGLRQHLAQEALSFYLDLLKTPLSDRLSYVYSLSEARNYRRLLALASGKLR